MSLGRKIIGTTAALVSTFSTQVLAQNSTNTDTGETSDQKLAGEILAGVICGIGVVAVGTAIYLDRKDLKEKLRQRQARVDQLTIELAELNESIALNEAKLLKLMRPETATTDSQAIFSPSLPLTSDQPPLASSAPTTNTANPSLTRASSYDDSDAAVAVDTLVDVDLEQGNSYSLTPAPRRM